MINMKTLYGEKTNNMGSLQLRKDTMLLFFKGWMMSISGGKD
jgi:hypothetical protein